MAVRDDLAGAIGPTGLDVPVRGTASDLSVVGCPLVCVAEPDTSLLVHVLHPRSLAAACAYEARHDGHSAPERR